MILNGKVSAFFLIMCNLARPHRIFFAQLTFCHHCMDAFCTSSFDSPHSDTRYALISHIPKIDLSRGERTIAATSVPKPLFNII